MNNMLNKKLLLALGLLGFVLIISCTKEAGYGGLSSIQGKVYTKDITPNSQIVQDSGYTANIKVFISADESSQVLDEVRTDLDGSFKFDKLRKGNYTIWTFTQCDACTNNETPVIQQVEIKGRKESIVLSDFNIII